MIYVKSIAAGLLGALLAAVMMLVLELLAIALLAAWQTRSGGVAGGTVPIAPPLVFAAAGFVFGFWWIYRKRAA